VTIVKYRILSRLKSLLRLIVPVPVVGVREVGVRVLQRLVTVRM